MRLFGSHKPQAPQHRYGVDTPTAFESVNWHRLAYSVWPSGEEHEVDWEMLTSEERLELDRLLWKSRPRKVTLRAV